MSTMFLITQFRGCERRSTPPRGLIKVMCAQNPPTLIQTQKLTVIKLGK